MRIIAFTGPKGSGKDTAAKCLFKHNAGHGKKLFRHAPMAEGVKNICEDFFGWDMYDMSRMEFKETPRALWEGGPVMAPRWPMMDIANWMRDRFGGGVHAARWAMHAGDFDNAQWGAHVTTDLRFPEEVDVFESNGKADFLPIYVERAEAEEALAAKQNVGDAMALNASESHYTFLREYCEKYGAVVSNNTSIGNLHAQVNTVVKVRLGYWGYWDCPKLEPIMQDSYAPAHGCTSTRTLTGETNHGK